MHIDRYERAWLTAVGIALGAFAAAMAAGFILFGIRLPSPVARINPNTFAGTPYANPGIKSLGGGRYEVFMTAKMWSFDAGRDSGPVGVPPRVKIPRGSEVTFYVTSLDVDHGFYIEGHAINLEVIPGQVARATVTFMQAGEFNIICNQYLRGRSPGYVWLRRRPVNQATPCNYPKKHRQFCPCLSFRGSRCCVTNASLSAPTSSPRSPPYPLAR